jgi:hypothetical protein
MSSHSNPHGIAFNLAARQAKVPIALISHGMPIKPVARLQYDLAVVHCEAARQTYVAEGSLLRRVFVHGRKQDYSPMVTVLPEKLTLGIFLCKDVNERTLQALVRQALKDPRVAGIMIRPHPKNLWRGLEAWIAALNDPRVRLSPGGKIAADVQLVEVVVAGNSSVLVDALTGGRPSAFVPYLDHGPVDLHAFVERRLVYQIDELSLDLEGLLGFYQHPEWLSVLRLFANIDEDEAAVAGRTTAALQELIGAKVASRSV